MKLLSKTIIVANITTKTGLTIGGSNAALSIGSADKIVIRNPLNSQPYIPGSSIKGKFRSLIEISQGTVGDQSMGQVKNAAYQGTDKASTLLFGSAQNSDKLKQRPSRLIVGDAHLTPESLEKLEKAPTDVLYAEIKAEAVIDRITSAAVPRFFERVPAGVSFEFTMILNEFEDDDVEYKKQEKELKSLLAKAIRLLKDDYLGGGGSRGNGQIDIQIKSAHRRNMSWYMDPNNEIGENVTEEFTKMLVYA
ncbi:MAG: type III-A CRISPR-associated RAMP protein Csm3 [Bacteroidota bacterium]|nr:type III-A CRISPR-associated RAMP protein Csm3 [Bacteroidota bacterium]